MRTQSAAREITRRPAMPRSHRHPSRETPGIVVLSIVATAWLSSSVLAAATDSPGHSSRHAYGFRTHDDGTNAFEYAIIDPSTSSMTSSTHRDFDSLERLARKESRELFWFSFDGKDYVVRDAGWVARARQIVAPMEEIGERQSHLGAEQSALGDRQSTLGEEQGRIGGRMGKLGGRLASLSVRDALSGDDRDAESARAAIRQQMETLRARMEELRQKQQPLAAQQRELGRRQAALGRQQQWAAAAAAEALENLAREAVRSGKAERVGD